MEEAKLEIDKIIKKINNYKIDFKRYIKSLYTEYEKLMAEYMIAKGLEEGGCLYFKVPLVVGDLDEAVSLTTSRAFEEIYRKADFATSTYESYELYEAFECYDDNPGVPVINKKYPCSFNWEFQSIWEYMAQGEVIDDICRNVDLGGTDVELVYTFKLSDAENKVVMMSIRRVDHFMKSKSCSTFLDDIDSTIQSESNYEDILFLSEIRISETYKLLLNSHYPISAPCFIKPEEMSDNIELEENTFDDDEEIPF